MPNAQDQWVLTLDKLEAWPAPDPLPVNLSGNTTGWKQKEDLPWRLAMMFVVVQSKRFQSNTCQLTRLMAAP